MSALYSLRRKIRDVLLADGWCKDEVLIRRRTDIWNDISVATNASEHGHCLVIGVATGRKIGGDRPGTRKIMMEVTVPITLIELPNLSPEQPEEGDADEDGRWEAMCLLLQGEALGRSALHYELDFDGFEDVEDEDYVIRQTTFKTRLILQPTT